jgi:predicted nucleotidyltransferase
MADALVYGSVAGGANTAASDIDMIAIGDEGNLRSVKQ